MIEIKLKELLINSTKEDKTITENIIDLAIASNNLANVESLVRSKFSISIWDKVSNINNATAEIIKNQIPFKLPNWNGLAYQIKAGEKTLYFQTHDFEQQGFIPILNESKAFELANKQVESLVEEGIMRLYLSKLRGV